MFGRLRMSVEQAKKWYLVIVSEVFSDKKWFKMDCKYKLTKIEKVVERMLVEHTGDTTGRMLDTQAYQKECKVCVPLTELSFRFSLTYNLFDLYVLSLEVP
jgi:hypothetical protein